MAWSMDHLQSQIFPQVQSISVRKYAINFNRASNQGEEARDRPLSGLGINIFDSGSFCTVSSDFAA